MNDSSVPSLGKALGRLPVGLFVVGIDPGNGEPALGLVASLLTQVGLQPPTICVAIGKERDHFPTVMERGSFAVSILGDNNSGLMGNFFRPVAAGQSPFDELATQTTSQGHPVLTEALAWIEVKVTGSHEIGDHQVVFAEVIAGEQMREGEPAIHLRNRRPQVLTPTRIHFGKRQKKDPHDHPKSQNVVNVAALAYRWSLRAGRTTGVRLCSHR